MRRPAPEWLLLPVFLLPIAVAATFALVARSAYLGTIESYRDDGAGTARRWLDADPVAVAVAVARFDANVQAVAQRGTPFRRGVVAGVVAGTKSSMTEPPWEIAADFPGGLRPEALADASVRLSVEAGVPIAHQPGADAATAAFGRLATGAVPEALRAAPLPAGAKLHLLRRFAGDPGDPGEVAALSALRDADEVLDAVARAPLPGAHLAGSTAVLVPSSGTSVVVLPTDQWVVHVELPPADSDQRAPGSPQASGPPVGSVREIRVVEDPTGTAVLLWTPTRAHVRSEVVWTGALDRPLAGVWTIALPEGRTWWRADGVANWLTPVASACLAFLAIPTALLIDLRRRRRLDEARARFINEIAHDLRTPVAALRLHAELLSSGRSPEAERGKHIGVLGREAARISSLLANLLDLSRLERGTRPFDHAAVDASEVIHDVVREFGVLYPQRAADIALDAPAGLTIVADRTALARALANLLDNAGKFTPAGTRIRLRAEATPDGGARIVVADDGPGIAPDERGRVFLPYERGSAAAATAAPGTGLGLALVRDLVAGMGGTVTLGDALAESPPTAPTGAASADAPRGATFVVTIPGAADD